jgi:uncharacterized LabA/DUF88 family protein
VTEPTIPVRRRAIFYIDGFNLYYGAVRRTKYKWLDLQAYCQKLHPLDELVKVRYFTSQVVGPTQSNQLTFWRALRTTPLVQIHEGKFKRSETECGHTPCKLPAPRMFDRLLEKRTDVNIAIRMLHDAYQNQCDNMVLISGDSDLVPAVTLIRGQFPKINVFVYAPGREYDERHASELIKAANVGGRLKTTLFATCQFPDEITDLYGRPLKKPKAWA